MAARYIVVNPPLSALCQTDIERHFQAVPP